jgi:hypothetical protein
MFEQVAVPRAAGSPALVGVRSLIESDLRALGLTVAAQRFTASTARLSAVSVLGAGTGWVTLALYPLLVFPVTSWVVALVGAAGLTLIGLVAYGIAEAHLPSRAARVEAVNLEARHDQPRLWLVAHLDSKSQRVSLAGRVFCVAIFAIGLAALFGALAARLSGTLPWWGALVLTVPALLSGAVLSASGAGNDSAGAVDNATGVIAMLAAARSLRDRRDVGVLVTDAEELAMVGARAWVTATRRNGVFVNFDGVDSRGSYRIMSHARHRRGEGRERTSVAIATAVVRALRQRGQRARLTALPPGVLVDGVVLAQHGLPGITVSRGDWSTLRVVHTRRDVAPRVRIEAAVTAGEAVASAAREWLVDGKIPAP